jgi:hypothetical protein
MKATKDSAASDMNFPKDAAEFVKKMGIDTTGLEVEVFLLNKGTMLRSSVF